MTFLEKLYEQGYRPAESNYPNTAEYKAASKKVQGYEKELIEKMGIEFMEDYTYAKATQCSLETAYAFAQGVSFAMNLWLSSLSIFE